MVRRFQIIFGITFLVLFVVGCADPHRFTILTHDAVDCRIFSALHSVEKVSGGFRMFANATVGITSTPITQYRWESDLRVTGEMDFQLLLRPVIEESVIDSGLILTFFAAGGVKLDSAGIPLENNSAFRFPRDSTVMVTVYDEHGTLEVTVGCDTVVRRTSLRRESDDLAIHTLNSTDAAVLEVFSPQWHHIKLPKGDERISRRVR